MFTLIEGLPDRVIGIDVEGKMTSSDYQDVFIPAVEDKLKSLSRIDVVCRFAEGWQGIESGAVWQDMNFGITHIGHWGRIAIVIDNDWIEDSIDIFRHLWPGHLRHFDLDEFEKAISWAGQDDRTTVDCSILPGSSILQVEPNPGKALTEDDFASIREAVDDHIGAGKELDGLLIATEKFPGWEGFGALASHLKFVRDHHRKINRIALVTDSPLGSFADHAVDHFVKAEIRNFDFDQRQKALDWLTSE